MVSASVRTMSFFNNQAVSTRKDVSTDNKTDEFAKMMDKSINKANDSKATDEVKNDSKVDEKSKVSENEFDKKYKEVVENDQVEDESEIKSEEIIATEEIVENVEEIPVEITNEMMTLLANILNVTVDELKVSLENLGIEGKDLLDMENVTKLVMDLKGIDNKMELLVHNDANDAIKEIGKSIEELMEKISQEKEPVTFEENVETTEEIVEVKPVIQEEVTEEAQVDDKITTNIVDDSANMSETKENAFSNESEKQDDSSKFDKTESLNNNAFEEIKGNIVNEIQFELENRVDESISTRIVREIAENITVAVREKMTSLEMQLNPEHLGKVTILLATEEGGITAKITAETEMAKNAIEQQLTLLKENFDKQGLKVADIEVTIASHGFEQNLDKEDKKNEGQQKKNSGIRRSLLDELNGVTSEEEKQEDIMMQALGNTVSYLA